MRQGKKKRRRMSEKENSNQFLLLCSVCSKRTGVHGPEKGLGLRPLFFTFLFRLYIYPALLLPSSYPLKKRLRGGLATRLSSFFFVNRQELFFFLFIKFTFLKFAVAPTGRRRTSQNAASTFFNQQENGKERNVVNSGGNRHDTQPYKE